MRHVGNAAGLDVGNRADAKELNEKRYANQEHGAEGASKIGIAVKRFRALDYKYEPHGWTSCGEAFQGGRYQSGRLLSDCKGIKHLG